MATRHNQQLHMACILHLLMLTNGADAWVGDMLSCCTLCFRPSC